MRFVIASDFNGSAAWDTLPLANMSGVVTQLYWTDEPYQWHTTEGGEVFAVLDGVVDMHYKDAAGEHIRRMIVGDVFIADGDTEHAAHPVGEARILVVEQSNP